MRIFHSGSRSSQSAYRGEGDEQVAMTGMSDVCQKSVCKLSCVLRIQCGEGVETVRSEYYIWSEIEHLKMKNRVTYLICVSSTDEYLSKVIWLVHC